MPLKLRRDPAPVYKRYQTYKRHLREDFCYQCVYCDIHENEYGGLHHFHVEHFRPYSLPQFAALELSYANLLYACGICNKRKGNDWPSDTPLVDGRGYLDPCEHDYEQHFGPDVSRPYHVRGLSGAAEYMVTRLRLNRKQLRRLRERREHQQRTYQESLRQAEIAIEMVRTAIGRLGNRVDTAWVELYDSLIAERDAIQLEWDARLIPEFEDDDYR